MPLKMQLPSDLLVFVFLAAAACALPQAQSPPATTANASGIRTTIPPTWIPSTTVGAPTIHTEKPQSSFETSTSAAHFESSQTGFTPPSTARATTFSPSLIFTALPTATGFDDDASTRRTLGGVQSKSDNVVVTNGPSLIAVETKVATTRAAQQPGDAPQQPSDAPQQPGYAPAAASATASAQPTSGGDILTEIISHIARPGLQGTSVAPATAANSQQFQQGTGSLSPAANSQQPQQGTGGLSPAATAVPGSQPSMVVGGFVGGLVTLGPATLTLTPGLSTVVGTGSAATLIAITTDGTGKTFIQISSSGTAVTATITNVPTTSTVSGTGFDASLTGNARPGSFSAAPTSSKRGAAERRVATDWWTSAVLGIVGLGVAL